MCVCVYAYVCLLNHTLVFVLEDPSCMKSRKNVKAPQTPLKPRAQRPSFVDEESFSSSSSSMSGESSVQLSSRGVDETPPSSPLSPSVVETPNLENAEASVSQTESEPPANRPNSKRKSDSVTLAATRVLSNFRGSTMPEHKGRLPKVGHTSVSYKRDIYLFGGVNPKGQYSNHIFCHEKRSLLWTEKRGVGVVPRGRVNHSAVIVNDKMYIYGGHRQLEVFDDLFSFNFLMSRWEKVGFERTQGPGPVFLHSSVYIPTMHSIFIVGGIHQREHNIYLGHLFDIKNKVWSGVPGPTSVDPQHLQFVTAAFYEPKSSVVVLGITESDVMKINELPGPSVFFFNVNSFTWTKVDTATSPESPMPFRMEVVWERFLHDLLSSGGGLYDPVQQWWMFPVNLRTFQSNSPSLQEDNSRLPPPQSAGSVSVVGSSPTTKSPRHRATAYAFCVLRFTDMMWSLVPCKFPKKMYAELTRLNQQLEEEKPPEVPEPQQRQLRDRISEAEILNTSDVLLMSRLTFETARRNSARSSMSSARQSLRVARPDSTPPVRLPYSFFSVQGTPEFMRKYTLTAVREAPTSSGKIRPIQYIVMHGGSNNTTDYTMLMFVPMTIRVDTMASAKLTSYGSKLGNWNGEGSLRGSGSGSSISESTGYLTKSTRDATTDSFAGGDSSFTSSPQGLNRSMANDGFLLPVLPKGRTMANFQRFAIQFCPANCITKESQLPYPSVPVAVLETPAQREKWSQNYYSDRRRWLAEKLTDAFAEDRKMRYLRRLAKLHSAASRRVSSVKEEASIEEDDSDSDSDSNVETTLLGDSFQRLSRGAGSSPVPGQKGQSTGTPGIDGAAGEDGHGHHRQRDFFEEKSLEPFVLEDYSQEKWGESSQSYGGSSRESIVSAGRWKSGDVNGPRGIEIVVPAFERLHMKGRRQQSRQQISSSIFGSNAAETEMAGAISYIMLRNALDQYQPDDISAETRSAKARLRWRFLRALVKTGEAAFLMYRVSQSESKTKGVAVTSTPGLLLAPELHFIGPFKAYKVPSRPVPYVVPHPPQAVPRFTQVTSSGMVVYHHMRNVS